MLTSRPDPPGDLEVIRRDYPQGLLWDSIPPIRVQGLEFRVQGLNQNPHYPIPPFPSKFKHWTLHSKSVAGGCKRQAHGGYYH